MKPEYPIFDALVIEQLDSEGRKAVKQAISILHSTGLIDRQIEHNKTRLMHEFENDVNEVAARVVALRALNRKLIQLAELRQLIPTEDFD